MKTLNVKNRLNLVKLTVNKSNHLFKKMKAS